MASKSSGVQLPGFTAVTLFDDLVRCEVRLYNALNERLRDRHGLVTSQFEFLCYLRDHPGARVADLAAHFAIGIGATSKAIDRHERLGWVRRDPNPDDRRSSLLSLTPAGAGLLAEAEPTFDATLRELMEEHVDRDRLAAAAAALAELRLVLERGQVGTPIG